MKTLLEVIQLADGYLAQRKVERSRRQAEELIADVLGMKRIDLYLQFERPLPEDELQKCRDALKRRGNGEPLQYIAGKVQFAGAEIKVTPGALIPRPETEILVESISATLKNQSLEGKVLWDMCAGTGCIGISLKKRFPELRVVLSDLSSDAIALCRHNAEANSVHVEFKEGDLFAPFENEKCDYFVSNPPYIAEREFFSLAKEVKDFEPRMALISGESGLEFYQRIANQLPLFINPEALGWLEIGAGQGEPVCALFKAALWPHCRFEKDWSGHDRFVFLHG